MAYKYDSSDSENEFDGPEEFPDKYTFDIPLYEHKNSDIVVNQGGLKSYDVKAGGSAIYSNRRSDFTTTVDRLLWIDGYEKTATNPGPSDSRKECTLIVLKIKIKSSDDRNRVEWFSATLQLEDLEQSGENEPEILAWAPFRNLERWNEAVAHKERTNATNAGLSAGYTGAELSLERSLERRVSWSQTDFDEGESSEEISKTTQRRNGVTWSVKQNHLQNHGALPELWVSALFSRASRKPYVVKFSFNTRAGKIQDMKDHVKKIFRTKPEQTTAFTVTPWKRRECNYEGHEILKEVDENNLGALRDSSTLNVTWGPKSLAWPPSLQEEVRPLAKSPNLENLTSSDGLVIAEESASQEHGKQRHKENGDGPIGDSAAINQGAYGSDGCSTCRAQPNTITLPPLVIGWQIANSGDVSGRLAALEQRIAQLESRLATQDMKIVQLQEGQLDTNIQLTNLRVVQRSDM